MHTQEDTLLADQVRKALALYVSDADAITIKVDHGVVTLSGTVANETERQSAFGAVRSVPRVQSVVDHLRLPDKDSQSMGEYVDDAFITTAVKGKLLTEAGIKSFSISVETNQGVVMLTGEVGKLEHATLAEQVAKMVNGVKRVDNRLVYKP